MGQWVVSVRRHEPPSESGIHPGRFPWRGYRAVHDRYITSPRQVHDRLNQIQSLRGDSGKPLRHDAAACAASRSAGSVAHHGAVPVFHPAGGRRAPGHRLRGSPRRDGAGRCGSVPRPRVRTRPARRLSRAERRRTGRPGCAECTSRASSPGARVTGQNGHGSAKQAVPRTAPPARTLSAYLHRRGDRKWFRDGPFTVLGRASLCSLALIAARFLRPGGRVRGREAPAQRRRRRP